MAHQAGAYPGFCSMKVWGLMSAKVLWQYGTMESRSVLVRVLLSRSVRSPFVGFVSVVDKAFVRRR